MKKEKSTIGLAIKLLFIVLSTILIFNKGWIWFGFLIWYKIDMLILFFHFKHSFLKSKLFKVFEKLYFSSDFSMILILLILLPLRFFVSLIFMLLYYEPTFFIILSIIQLILDFILIFEIIPSLINVFSKKGEDS